MAVRLMSCRHCKHMVRLGSMTCGSCGAYTPVANWTLTHVGLIVLALVLVIVGASFLF